MVANKSTMAGLASALTLLTGRPVVDETGLNGYYDFDVTWPGPEALNGQTPETQFGGPELIGLLISNLRNVRNEDPGSATPSALTERPRALSRRGYARASSTRSSRDQEDRRH